MSTYRIGDEVMVRRGRDAHRPGRVVRVLRLFGSIQSYEVRLDAHEILLVGEGNLKPDPTQWGFQFGPVEVTRVAAMPLHGRGKTYVLGIMTDDGHELQISVSQTGRSVRVYRRMRDEGAFTEMVR